VPGLGTSFGRGGATTAQQDLANADCILIEGSSMAEAHPVGFRWVVKAKERGATVIHVDPRFSRTSALADLWVPIRAGGDLAFLGGLVRHVIENGLFFREYVVHYTNAPVLLREDFRDTEDGADSPATSGRDRGDGELPEGLFSGWDRETESYDPTTWRYEGDDLGRPRKDPTLQHPRCVFQVLKRHFSRYTPEMVERVAGIPPELFHRVAKALTEASGPEKTAAICYAVGWTQHSKGVQIIRTAAILQLLLGNIGRPGGGILALRGHASIQGSTDIPTLFDILPGYLKMPRAGRGEATLAGYLENQTRETGLWHDTPAYMVSLLKAYYGGRARADNDWSYARLPRVTRDHSHFSYWTEMADGKVEGLFLMGQNPAVGAQNARLERRALARLKWLVVRDLVEIEPAVFWRSDSPEVRRGELVTGEIATEVFLMPAAGHAEKEGAFTQTQRMLQWREKAVDPPGDARSEAWFLHQLALRLKARAEASDDPADEPLRALDWWYPEDERGEPRMLAILAEINGWYTDPSKGSDLAGADGDPPGAIWPLDRQGRRHHGAQVTGFAELADDGSTACGCWIYSGVYGPDDINRANRREPEGPYGHGWGYAWPGDRRILYNRASARPDGQPWSDRKKLVWWDAGAAEWTGHDVPDFPLTKPPGYLPPVGARGVDAHPGDAPFVLHEDGLGWIFVPEGLVDGPLPTHYEPLESPLQNPLYKHQTNPPVRWYRRSDNPFAEAGDPRFPYVLTTYRLTEHHTGGGMSRPLSHLAELQPELFAEISPELAEELGIANGDWITVANLRGAIEARALVTRRIRPIHLGDRTVHQVAMPFHWGPAGPNRGDVVNDLVPLSGEPNVTIHESKALLCALIPGRRPPDEELDGWLQRTLGDDVARTTGDAAESPPRAEAGGHGQEGKS
jgi:formate dehydrogenase major subunit